MNGVKMKIRIGRPSCAGPRVARRVAAPGFPDPFACSRSRASLTCPGISAQNQPNRLASGRATRKAAGARSQVTASVKNSADEMLR